MKQFPQQAIAFLLALLASSCTTNHSKEWDYLFNEKDLKGWHTLGGQAPFTIEDERIVATMVPQTPNSFLVTDKSYKDFILELDFKIEGNSSNSGIQIRGQKNSNTDSPHEVEGLQVEIDPSSRSWTGGIYDEARRGWLYPLDLNANSKDAYKSGEFNQLRVEAIGKEIKTWVNGVPCAYLIDTLHEEGFIGLQAHSINDPELEGQTVSFKNIRIKTENLSPSEFPSDIYIENLTPNELSQEQVDQRYKLLFDGQSTSEWQGVSSDSFPKSGWEVDQGALKIAKAPDGQATSGGDIISKDVFSAFDLSFEFKLTSGANSGIKYLLSDQSVGFEYQILDDALHPDAKMGMDNNRTLASLYDIIPSDQNPRARRPIGQWNKGRILVTKDNTIHHYLNGYEVLSVDRNSEKFLDKVKTSKFKDRAGFTEVRESPILLQDHSDEVHFRSIRIKKL